MKFPEKLKLIRQMNNLTQDEFAKNIGISRGNLSCIELGKVDPTQLFINCVSLMYNIDKKWLTDDESSDLSALNGYSGLLSLIVEQYDRLSNPHKKFVENQIKDLLQMQTAEKSK